ncbi:hypothetical protein BURPS305_1084 [Burkholderia pseudomallei 305]|nr:hypothetical protein GBP346_A1644 [Burkholderia pseudomallei MSHR346]EBA45975.1 hypothetical protein BURPS305_1084 [Burkholderia pseudomallei 305]EEH30520.1 hypothetical protein BUH_2317 [Burkholderia pseudomallei Pakistan 9]
MHNIFEFFIICWNTSCWFPIHLFDIKKKRTSRHRGGLVNTQ